MTYTLLIGQRLYSSWSLRGWLPFVHADIPVTVQDTLIYSPDFYADIARFGGVSTVPVARAPDGSMLTDSLSIGWHLAETFPDRGLLPDAPAARARAISLIGEMHGGFSALRSACPMNLATGWEGFVPDDAVRADITRIDTAWQSALDASGGPFLFGSYGLVDAFFAPVAMRIAGYDLPVSDGARAYVDAHLADPALKEWRAEGLARDKELSNYDMDLPRCAFPAC